MTAAKRPEECYVVRRDRSITPRRSKPEVAAAFRVHFHHPDDPSDVHRVTKWLWECEAVTAAKNLAAAGFKLLDIPEYPGGIERVRGWDESRRQESPSLEPYAWERKKAADFGELFRSEDDVMKKVTIAAAFKTKVLDKLPEGSAIRSELEKLFTAGE